MKQKKKIKWNKKRIILFIFIFITIAYFIKKNDFSLKNKPLNEMEYSNTNTFSDTNTFSEYAIIKQDTNSNYLGVGQKKVENKNGYFTTFQTQNGKVYKEYKQNGSASWSKNAYWDNTMESDGCGITAISIILSGYKKSLTPEDLRKRYYPVLHGDNISYELTNTFGITNSDFLYDQTSLSNTYIKNHLKDDNPILICVWNKPKENRWTTASHYMVLLATDSNEMVYVSNPNGLENDSKSSGWYNINEISPYIAKALFIKKQK